MKASPQPMLRSPGNEIHLWRYIRYVGRRLGVNPIHDFSQQEKGFGTTSAFINASTRLSLIVETATNNFQIPDVPGQPVWQMGNPPVTSSFGITNFNQRSSTRLRTRSPNMECCRCRNRSTASMGSSPTSPATTIRNLRRISSATCC